MSFSGKQNSHYRPLVKMAWEIDRENHPETEFLEWYEANLLECVQVKSTTFCNQAGDFETAMLHFAIIANDDYWLDRCTRGDERRMIWQIKQFMRDLEYLQKRPVDWQYIRAIHSQSAPSRRKNTPLVPDRLSDCPPDILRSVLAMLDTHIRRLCRDYDIKPCHLPTRQHPKNTAPAAINPDAKHLHIGHDLDRFHAPKRSKRTRRDRHEKTAELPF